MTIANCDIAHIQGDPSVATPAHSLEYKLVFGGIFASVDCIYEHIKDFEG